MPFCLLIGQGLTSRMRYAEGVRAAISVASRKKVAGSGKAFGISW